MPDQPERAALHRLSATLGTMRSALRDDLTEIRGLLPRGVEDDVWALLGDLGRCGERVVREMGERPG